MTEAFAEILTVGGGGNSPEHIAFSPNGSTTVRIDFHFDGVLG